MPRDPRSTAWSLTTAAAGKAGASGMSHGGEQEAFTQPISNLNSPYSCSSRLETVLDFDFFQPTVMLLL